MKKRTSHGKLKLKLSLSFALLLSLLLAIPMPVLAAPHAIYVENGYADLFEAEAGYEVTVRASEPYVDPSTEMVFLYWWSETVEFANPYAEQTTFTMIDEPVNVYSAWKEKPGTPSNPTYEVYSDQIYLYWDYPWGGGAYEGFCISGIGQDYYTTDLSWSFFNLEPNTFYTFYLTTYDDYGNYSDPIVYEIMTTPEEEIIHTIWFDTDGGPILDPYYVYDNDPIGQLPQPTRKGYRFTGWYDRYNPSDFYDGSEIAWTDLYLMAAWEPIQSPTTTQLTTKPTATTKPSTAPTTEKETQKTTETVQDESGQRYQVTFNSMGGTKVAPQKVQRNGRAQEPSAPQLAGRTFLGWFDGLKPFDFNQPVTKNLYLTAHWGKGSETTTTEPTASLDNETSDSKNEALLDPALVLPETAGELSGPLCDWLGLSGSYDASIFDIDMGLTIPSLRLSLKYDPRCYIEFMNPAVTIMPDEEDAETNLNYMVLFRNSNIGPFGPKRIPDYFDEDNVVPLTLGQTSELAYLMQTDELYQKEYRDYFTRFENSLAVTTIVTPEGKTEERETLQQALQGITQGEGNRPVIHFAKAFNQMKHDVVTEDSLAWADNLENYFVQETYGQALNLEVMEQLYDLIKQHGFYLASYINRAGFDEENITAADEAHLKSFASLDYVVPEFEIEEWQDNFITFHIDPYALARPYLAYFPEQYDVIAWYEDNYGEAQRAFDEDAPFDAEACYQHLAPRMELAQKIGEQLDFDAPYAKELIESIELAFDDLFYLMSLADTKELISVVDRLIADFSQASAAQNTFSQRVQFLLESFVPILEADEGTGDFSAYNQWIDDTYFYYWEE